jgi:hypothetical protein
VFIRKKKIKAHYYAYLVENYRCPDTGKRKQRVLNYLGRVEEGEEAGEQGSRGQGVGGECVGLPNSQLPTQLPVYLPGDWVWFRYIGDRILRGQVIPSPLSREEQERLLLQWVYLTYSGEQSAIPLERVIGKDFPLGAWVEFDSELGTHVGTVIETTSQVPACPWPKQKQGSEVIRVPIVIPGVVSVCYEWLGTSHEVQLPVSQVRAKFGVQPAGHGKEPEKLQLSLFV